MSTFFGRVRSRFEGYQEDVHPHEWRFSSSYSTSSKDGRATLIPDPAVFRNALIPNPSVPGAPAGTLLYPDLGHEAVHLALIECFYNLRHSATKFGTKSPKPQPPSYQSTEGPKQNPAFDSGSESEQWDLLLRIAITRFEAWWTNLDHVFKHAKAYTHHAGDRAVVQLTKDYLPPLDVLLVWYSLMLASEDYAKACHKCEMPYLTHLCFPWPAIRDTIDTETMTLTITHPAETLFKRLTDQPADILQYIQSPPAYAKASVFSPSIDLFSIVKKQDPFFDLSHNLLWIRSPSLASALERSSAAYLNAQTTNDLFFMPPEDLPFGVDLIWRTHRLYPEQYWLFRQDSSHLSAPNEATEPQHLAVEKKPSNHPPTETTCVCWTCERIRDDFPSFTLSGKESLPNRSSFLETASDWNPDTLSSLSPDQLRSIQDDLGFYHAVENARTQGLPLPTRPRASKEKEVAKREAAKRRSRTSFGSQ